MSKRVLGLYMYATGSQRQPITLLSHLGLSDSYPSIVGTTQTVKSRKPPQPMAPEEPEIVPTLSSPAETVQGSVTAGTTALPDTEAASTTTNPVPLEPPKPTEKKYRTGTLLRLSGFMRAGARMVAATGMFAGSYDNINIAAKSAEQIIGRNCEVVPYLLLYL